MHYTYKTSGTCSRAIDFDIEDGVIRNVKFTGGCNGNLKGIGKLVEGMKVEDVAANLRGIPCG
ncbi:MAG: TIGR03905 family TSCPD domain-containing protein, partial [Clostridia bacterium]|nr:TIGR03905 family TSCPD domain-containing protein [Clostridia bacterium]